MKKFKTPIIILSLIALTIFSCKKGNAEMAQTDNTGSAKSMDMVTDSVSMAATQEIKDRKFVKTADVNMEVKDVYESSIFIEKKLQELGGFVTSSNLNARVLSENTYQTSDEDAMLVKKYQTENRMQVRIPTEHLGGFLTFINDKKVFLNSRTILAEDVTNNARIAQLENSNIKKTEEVIEKMKNDKDKVELTTQNLSEKQYQNLANISLADNLKYSTVDIYIQEPTVRIAEIAVTNTKGIDQKYQFNFLYDLKNALQEGFYLIQRLIIGLVTIWPFILILGAGFYFWRKRKNLNLKIDPTKLKNREIIDEFSSLSDLK